VANILGEKMTDHKERGAVLVTGASTGIGEVTALYLDRLGFKVFATVRKERDGDMLSSKGSERLTPILLDVTDKDTISLARKQVTRAVGDSGLLGLINNAGVGFTSPLEFVPLEELRRLFEVNVFGLLAVTQSFLPLLRQAQGRIVNISAAASIFVAPFHGPYAASKWSVNALSKALRLELRPLHVQVSLIVCGSIRTPMWEKAASLSKRITQRYPADAWTLYGSRYQKLRDYFAKIGHTGVAPEVVSRSIAHALTAKRVKNTYFVGPDARLFTIADKLLFGAMREWVILRSIGLHDRI
jgi:NAD(P)-dependent dehydrogenase (short-subunit alcohol dehydrogenase family)